MTTQTITELLSLNTFDCPKTFLGNPVVASAFVPRRPGLPPFHVAVVADADAGSHHVARLLATGESASTRYHVGGFAAAKIMVEIAERAQR